MRILLDTHVLLWAIAEPKRLSSEAAELLRDTRNSLLVSAASAWEIATKYRLDRLPNAEPIIAGYLANLRTLGADELTIRSEHALLAGSFDVDHRDPFDRTLAAQALIEGVPLLTNDRAFGLFKGLATIW